MGDKNVYKILDRIPEGKRSLGRTRRRWEDDIGIDLREVAQVRDKWRAVVDTVLNLRVL
jgi:hypothetical protein